MPPQIFPSHAPSINQPITDGTFNLPLLQSTSLSKQDAAAHKTLSGSSSLLSSPLQHQTTCLQAIHKTIRKFTQDFKAEHLDRKTLQPIVLQLQNDLALLRHLLFSSVATTSISEIVVINSTTSPLTNPNPNPTSIACTEEPKFSRSTPVCAVGRPRAKTNNSANADFQPSPKTWGVPPTTVQNFTPRICKLEKLFAGEIATYTSITAGIHSQNFF